MSRLFKPFNQRINNCWINTKARSCQKHVKSPQDAGTSLRGNDTRPKHTAEPLPLLQTYIMNGRCFLHDFIIRESPWKPCDQGAFSSLIFANVKRLCACVPPVRLCAHKHRQIPKIPPVTASTTRSTKAEPLPLIFTAPFTVSYTLPTLANLLCREARFVF